jgi:hypothetical protein
MTIKIRDLVPVLALIFLGLSQTACEMKIASDNNVNLLSNNAIGTPAAPLTLAGLLPVKAAVTTPVTSTATISSSGVPEGVAIGVAKLAEAPVKAAESASAPEEAKTYSVPSYVRDANFYYSPPAKTASAPRAATAAPRAATSSRAPASVPSSEPMQLDLSPQTSVSAAR